jgi:fructokinase
VDELYGGVETGGTWTVCALGTGPDHITAYEQFPTGTPRETLAQIISFFEAHPRPRAIGIGSFGPLDVNPASETWGYVTTTPKPNWQHTSVAPVIRDRLEIPVAFDLDVTAAALAEQRWGAGRPDAIWPNLTARPERVIVCYLTVGTGIGAGLLLDGEPWHGLIHPEVGHLRIPHDRERDPFDGVCPTHGDCWEGIASGEALAARLGQPAPDLPDEHPAWQLEAEYIALGVLSIVSVASPHRVILGGGVMEREFMFEKVRAHLRQLVAGYLETPLLADEIERYLVPPALGDRAGVLGAIAMAIEI